MGFATLYAHGLDDCCETTCPRAARGPVSRGSPVVVTEQSSMPGRCPGEGPPPDGSVPGVRAPPAKACV